MIGRLAAVTVGLALGLLTTSCGAGAQPAGKVYRIGYLTQGTGQVGAGTVRAPLGCFTAALEALARSRGAA